ncbi:hypothetical protein Agub_g4843 [Astrephomene gubernaculifera]|uniref:Kinetochore protein Spc24 n=1 Tax=Astrephomene gubernaculifera TaxID=47775 RepID=A0AAD3HK35_9CHLO|nr:hypothetical protein Agub_g4843 [Astrephomene gubernaculifera]
MARPNEMFASEVQVMKALFQDFSKRNDIDAVAAVDQDVQDIGVTCSAREADIRQIIKELSKEVQELEAKAAYPNREGQHLDRVVQLKRAIDIAKGLAEEMSSETRSTEERYQQLGSELKAAMAAAETAAVNCDSAIKMNMHLVSLYAHISNIVWREDLPELVKGNVSDCKKVDIRSFEFDPRTTSKFDICNGLWELM